MKHLILGTAGHVDHGKTALVKALTGIDCDTHKEEKRRGITINLGFAHLRLASGDTLGVIDVPGHRDFIHTMVSGASGIDIALLVVAADSGVMPQTREHVNIMQLLGIRTGIIALTRIDLASPDVTHLAAEEVSEFVRGTFLEASPIVKVSAVTGAGIEELKKTIESTAATVSGRCAREGFRMYIDRIFTVSGFGAVVTGSVLGGEIGTGVQVYLMPSGRELRVRRIERYGEEVETVCAGDRASLNLVGLSREEFVRGMMITGRPLRTTTLLDARFRLFERTGEVSLWSNVLFLMGTFEAQARIHLLDRDKLLPGGSAIIQIHLPAPCVAQHGDRFVLRSTSSDTTLGGGEIIDASPLHHRRRPAELVQRLEKLAEGKHGEIIAAEIRKQSFGIGLDRLADLLNITEEEIREAFGDCPPDIRPVSSPQEKGDYYITKSAAGLLVSRCKRIIAEHHRKYPLLDEGKTAEELCGMLGIGSGHEGRIVVRCLLEELKAGGELKNARHTWVLASHEVKVSEDFQKYIRFVEDYVKKSGMKIPPYADMAAAAAAASIDEQTLRQVVRYLVGRRIVYGVEDAYIHGSIVDQYRMQLLEWLSRTPEGLTVARFRDLLEANRKAAHLLNAIFDGEGIIERRGDVRVITEKGKALAGRCGKGAERS